MKAQIAARETSGLAVDDVLPANQIQALGRKLFVGDDRLDGLNQVREACHGIRRLVPAPFVDGVQGEDLSVRRMLSVKVVEDLSDGLFARSADVLDELHVVGAAVSWDCPGEPLLQHALHELRQAHGKAHEGRQLSDNHGLQAEGGGLLVKGDGSVPGSCSKKPSTSHPGSSVACLPADGLFV